MLFWRAIRGRMRAMSACPRRAKSPVRIDLPTDARKLNQVEAHFECGSHWPRKSNLEVHYERQ
jgi:hypothetical protein